MNTNRNGNFDVKAFAEKLRKQSSTKEIERRFTVFISHSSEDTDMACQLRNLLAIIPEMYVILDECSFKVGERLPERIEEEIKRSDCFVVFITKNAEKSVWVNQEIGVAINTNIKIIPIVEDGVCTGLLEGRKYISLCSGAIQEACSIICDYQTQLCR